MELRTLHRSEREPLLDLLDLWELPDGWRGRDFFRRYLEDDPSFAEENVWVAVESGRLVSSVQIFPRALAIRGEAVPTGGIGSVFTLPEYRQRGVAGALLDRAAEAMSASGFELSLLFAARIAWYTRLGWRSRVVSRTLLEPGRAAAAGADLEIRGLDPARDLADVEAVHRRYSGRLDGTVVRDGALWNASLANAGNPDEDFRVARSEGELLAYARTTLLWGFPVVTEFGRGDGDATPLAELLAGMIDERAIVGNLHLDPGLERALDARGFTRTRLADASTMLRCIDAAALARRLGLAAPEAVDPGVWLETVIPAERFAFWSSDRF